MKCAMCGEEAVERRTTIETPYHYAVSGLPIRLSGIRLWKCEVCREEMPIIPRIEELHNLIAEMVVRKPSPLSGNEIKFLRKHAGYPAKEFAKLLRVTSAHLSRVENGHIPSLGKHSDMLARTFVIATTRGGEIAREVFLDLAKRLGKKDKRTKASNQQSMFSLGEQGWKAAA